MAGATANATPTQPGGTGSVAQAGAMGSNGGTTTGTMACSSCCAPQGRYLVSLFGGYGYTGNCPGAVDNSQPFDLYFTAVLSFDSPYTAAQFCLPSSVTITAKAMDYLGAKINMSTCSVISPPSTQDTVESDYGSNVYLILGSANNVYVNQFYVRMCSCSFANRISLIGNFFGSRLLTVISCSPPVYSFSANIWLGDFVIGTAAITITF